MDVASENKLILTSEYELFCLWNNATSIHYYDAERFKCRKILMEKCDCQDCLYTEKKK